MPSYEWLQPDERNKRRSIADATDLLPSDGAWRGEIRVGGLQLLSGEVVGQVAVFAKNAVAGSISIVTLPTCKKSRGRRQGSQEVEEFDIFRLDGAIVDGSGTVELVDGTRLRAVEVVPALLPYNVTDLDWRILHHTIALMEAEEACCTYPTPFGQPNKALDCSKLPGLRGKVPPRKEILRYIAKQEPALKRLSRQKIADTLHKFGML
ncbi:hypothetical protein [Bradyrhizobium lupini]